MNLEFKNNKFVISDLDYEMMQIFFNSIYSEKNKITEKLFFLTSCLFKDYSQKEKEEFKMQIDFLRIRQNEINIIFNEINNQFENMTLF